MRSMIVLWRKSDNSYLRSLEYTQDTVVEEIDGKLYIRSIDGTMSGVDLSKACWQFCEYKKIEPVYEKDAHNNPIEEDGQLIEVKQNMDDLKLVSLNAEDVQRNPFVEIDELKAKVTALERF